MKMHFLIIDPQNDFCDESGSLYVQGANDDMKRLATVIERLHTKIDDVHVTLDSHRYFDIAHPVYWRDSDKNHPTPFTIISKSDVESGLWKTSIRSEQDWGTEYVRKLEAQGKFPLCIWPPHCKIGTYGHNVQIDVMNSLDTWEQSSIGAMVDYVTKGSNYRTEHYGGLMSEVPDPQDPTTQLNTSTGSLIDILQNVDMIVVAGEALSHCLATTLTQLIENFGDDNAKKITILEDCTSPVTGFEQAAEDFKTYAKKHGVSFVNSTEFLK